MNLTDPFARTTFIRRSATLYYNHRRRARLDHQELGFTLGQLRAKIEYLETCAYCGVMLRPETFAGDHDLPTSRLSGPPAWSLANLVICCVRCNEQKGNMSGREFRELLETIKDFHLSARTSLLARLRAGAKKVAGKGW